MRATQAIESITTYIGSGSHALDEVRILEGLRKIKKVLCVRKGATCVATKAMYVIS